MRVKTNQSDESSVSDSDSDEEEVTEIKPLVEDKEDKKKLLSFMEEKGTKAHSPLTKKPRLDSTEALKEIQPPQLTYPWSDEPTGIHLIVGHNNCFYRSLAFFVYTDESLHECVRQELIEFLIANKHHSWIKYFGGANGVEEYARKFSRLGEWGSSMQLLLATKLYNTNFVLYQPDQLPRFVPFFVDKNLLTGAMEPRVGFLRYQGFPTEHFDVAKFEVKENV